MTLCVCGYNYNGVKCGAVRGRHVIGNNLCSLSNNTTTVNTAGVQSYVNRGIDGAHVGMMLVVEIGDEGCLGF